MATESLDPLLAPPPKEPPLAPNPMPLRLHADVQEWIDDLATRTGQEKASIARELMRRGWRTVAGQVA